MASATTAGSRKSGNRIIGDAGDDLLIGTSDDELILGRGGDDVLDGGSGSDIVDGGRGDDVLIFTLAENAGETNLYDGGKGEDTLRLNLTLSEFEALRGELVALQAFIAATADPNRSSGHGFADQSDHSANHPLFETSFGLTVRNVEVLEVHIEGFGLVDPANTAPVVGDTDAATDEDAAGGFAIDLLATASDADGDALSLGNVHQTAGRSVVFTVTDGVLAFDPTVFNDLAVGEFEDVAFEFTVDDGNGSDGDGFGIDARTATVTVRVEGRNDAPTAIALSNASVAEDAEGAVIGALTVSDVDTSDTHSFSVSDSRFEIVGNQLKLKEDVSLNFETEPTVTVDVTATDPGGLEVSESFEIDVSFAGVINLSDLDGGNGFVVNGVGAVDFAGHVVSAAGDVNGDGFDDFIVGAPYADVDGLTNAGASYVVFGGVGGASSLNLSDLDGSNGFRLDGSTVFDFAGFAVSGAGDVNGDGFADVIVGAYNGDPILAGESTARFDAGESYVVFGRPGGFDASLDLDALDGSNGFVIAGVDVGDWSGKAVSSAGDVNGDGYGDLIIGATRGDPNGVDNAGESYVVFGHSGGFSATFDLGSLDGVNGFVINGVDAGDRSGISVSAAGDVNGDGFGDLIIGSSQANYGAGESYVVFGKAGGFDAAIELGSGPIKRFPSAV